MPEAGTAILRYLRMRRTMHSAMHSDLDGAFIGYREIGQGNGQPPLREAIYAKRDDEESSEGEEEEETLYELAIS
jgi:hypothetical protein